MPSASTIPTGCRSRCAASASKGVGRAAFAPISWDDALDEVAEGLTRAAQRHGPEAVWPYYYAGTMGLVQRDGINRLRHAMRYSREDSDDLQRADRCRLACRGRRQARRRRARDRQIGSDRRLGRQSGLDPGQRDDATSRPPARSAAPSSSSIDPYRTASAESRRPAPGAAARHRRRARLRGHACAVQGGLCRPRLSGALYRRSARARSPSGGARPDLGGGDHRPLRGRNRRFRPALRPHPAQLTCASAMAFRARATARRSCSR